MTTEVQKFLREYGLAKLEEQFSIIARRHSGYNNLVCLKYNMIDSPMSERITQECRGIILDEENDWAIVSRSFDKFFNFGEGHAAKINWDTANVQEKLDGSLMALYHYRDKWHVQSSGTADASGQVNGAMLEWRENSQLIKPFPNTFADYFWQIVVNTGMSISPYMKNVPVDVCFMFEMMGPLNRIIVKHDVSKLVLIGARELSSQELTPKYASTLLPGKVSVVNSYALQTIGEVAATLEHMSPLEQESYVIVDAKFNRIKVKSPAYVALHHAKGNEVTTKKLLAIALAGESDEWVSHFDEYKDALLSIRTNLNNLIIEVESDYKRIMDKIGIDGTQKEFAGLALKTKCPSCLFQFRAKKCKSIRTFISQMRIEILLKLLWPNEAP